jgi:hypothetical protein
VTRSQILAAAGGLSAALVVTAGIGYSTIDANAGNVEAEVEDPDSELTGPEAAAFGICAQSIWVETVVANVREFVLWRGVREDPGAARPAIAYSLERVTTSAEVFAALDAGGGVWAASPGCQIEADGDQASYCIKRGPARLDATQISCVKAAAEAVIGSVRGIEFAHLRAGPPRTLRTRHDVDKTPEEYLSCRAAGTCKAAK